jgi:hypothetical protein
MDEYMKIYFPQTASRSVTTDTFICDNGGFENDFLYYKGYISTYTSGSNTCTPNVPGWTPVTVPVTNRLEIMSSGIDPLIGIQKVKFGNKSLRINNRYGHLQQCEGNYGIDRVTKRFKVTAENRQFTVWYAVALENPSGHVNQQPFLNIKCDKAPADELCFDADFLNCAQSYSDPCLYQNIDVIDWACHRFNIPTSEIGNIATVEMIVADCGLSAHFGYAYIDGFCEPCTGSSLGSINLNGSPTDPNIGIQYYSCDGLTASVCGSYTLPTLCGDWAVVDITVPGYTIQNLTINESNKTFCFDFPISNFGANLCLDISALITFKSSLGMNLPAQSSNTIKICKDLYELYSYSVVVGGCNDNLSPDILSDDYYYVTVNISDPDQNGWTIQRQLLDPYDGESGLYTITSSSGDDQVILGPFLIQEGCWDIIISLPNCTYTDKICPPPFCSGCDAFDGLIISNVTCIPATTLGGTDTWSFDIFVPGSGSYTILGIPYNKGTTNNIPVGNISADCISYNIEDDNSDCIQSLIICPPVPCTVRNCNLEIYPGKITCTWNGFSVNLHSNISNLCYSVVGSSVTAPVPSSGDIGPFTGNTEVIISPSPCVSNPTCFKMLYLPKPNCNDPNIELSQGRTTTSKPEFRLKVVPNPFSTDELTLKTDKQIIGEFQYSIYNSSGKLIKSGKFVGNEQTINFEFSSGIYILRYKDGDGKENNYKFVKLEN